MSHILYFYIKSLYLYLLPLKLAALWQWTHHHGRTSRFDDLHQVAKARDHAFWAHSTTPNPSGSVTLVRGESHLSTSISIDYLSLLTKDESIIEIPKDPNWNLNFGQLTNETSVPNIFSNNRSQYVQNFHSPTGLHSSVPDSLSHTQSSKSNKSDSRQHYDNIIKDVMSDHSFRDSQNPEAK